MKIVLKRPLTVEQIASLAIKLNIDKSELTDYGKVLAVPKKINSELLTNVAAKLPEFVCISSSLYPLVHNAKTKIDILKDKKPIIIAGPCAIESNSQMLKIAEIVSKNGGHILRGGAFKPRTSPYSFQGLGEIGLEYLANAANEFNLLSITEAMSIEQISMVSDYADIIQIGARNMQNFNLLKAAGKCQKPVLLKRAPAANYKEFLLAAEYIMAAGNEQVILCERGIKSFERMTRNTLDLSIIPILQSITKLPIIVDPSHAVGVRTAIPQMALASIAAGANGVMLEIHPEPEKSISDPEQALSFAEFTKLATGLKKISLACTEE